MKVKKAIKEIKKAEELATTKYGSAVNVIKALK